MAIRTPTADVLSKSTFILALTNATQDGTGVDCFGYTRAKLIFHALTGAATTANYTLKDSADNSTFSAAITGATLASAVAASTLDALYVQDIDLTKRARYLKGQLVGTGTAGSASLVIELYNPADRSVAGSQTNTPVTAI